MNRGTLCPKGAGPARFRPQREPAANTPSTGPPGSDQWQRISWDEALGRIAALMKEDRDANFIAKTPDGPDGQPLAHAPACSPPRPASNEIGYMTHKVARTSDMLAFDNQARV